MRIITLWHTMPEACLLLRVSCPALFAGKTQRETFAAQPPMGALCNTCASPLRSDRVEAFTNIVRCSCAFRFDRPFCSSFCCLSVSDSENVFRPCPVNVCGDAAEDESSAAIE